MALPPNFLDEIRHRVALAGLIQRRTKLVKKGREWSGLCPFHNEKTPSFTVNEEKGFFHCFGCGAHGDAIGFVMRAENRSFVEAVELLAASVGLEVPKPTPEARERAVRDATLHEILEAAARFFQAQLSTRAGTAALDYLRRRGLDDPAIARFRLGYAPDGQELLKQHLTREFPPALAIEAGLVAERANGGGSFDYFRDRVIFPIMDRRGRVIAFGGRVMGDAKPKYLNSPETPVFSKGTVLYGLNWARDGVAAGADPIVTEGYMDVIALQRAGFAGAVAPLGTALTPEQLGEIWRLGSEPILCFDGDAAGQRAASRAVDRALPLLTAGRTLRLAILPDGEDPDSLIGSLGQPGMAAVLKAAAPLAEYLWSLERAARPVDTPERRADLVRRLAARAMQIPDAGLRNEYERFFRACRYERLDRRLPKGRSTRRPGSDDPGPAPPVPEATLRRRAQEALVLTILWHPEVLDEVVEEFAEIEFPAGALDTLRREILNVHASHPALDAAGLKHHLSERGFADDCAALDSVRGLVHAGFARSDDRDAILAGWRERVGWLIKHMTGTAEISALERDFERDPVSTNARFPSNAEEAQRRRLGMTDGDPIQGRSGLLER